MRLSTYPKRYWVGLVIAATLLVIFGGSLGLAAFEYWWRSTPEYSLTQIGHSIESHDVEMFHRHVDTRSVANRMFDDLATEAVRKDSSNALGRGMFEMFRPRLLESFESQVERFVETGQFNDEKTAAELGLDTLRDRFGTVGPISYVSINGSSAQVGLQVIPKGTSRAVILPLKMRRTREGYWQLTEIDLLNIKPATAK